MNEKRTAILWARKVIYALEKLNRAKGIPFTFRSYCYYLLKAAGRSGVPFATEAMLYTLSLANINSYMYEDGVVRVNSIYTPSMNKVLESWYLGRIPKCICSYVWNVFPSEEDRLPFRYVDVQMCYYSPTGELSYLYEENCKISHDGWDGIYGTYIPDEYMDGVFVPFHGIKHGYPESGLVRKKYELDPAWMNLQKNVV